MSTIDTAEFFESVEGFASLGQPEQVKLIGWHLLTHKGQARFLGEQVQQCFDVLHIARPNVSLVLKRLAEKRPAEVLKDRDGFRLETRVRSTLDKQHGRRKSTVVADELLLSVIDKIQVGPERSYLDEAMLCFRQGAFRAAIIMTWNVTFGHMVQWLLSDVSRQSKFNAAVGVRYPKKPFVSTYDEIIDAFRESEVIEACGTAGLLTGNPKKILLEKLTKRNMAAHPSNIHFSQLQAEEFITDLVGNVLLKLT